MQILTNIPAASNILNVLKSLKHKNFFLFIFVLAFSLYSCGRDLSTASFSQQGYTLTIKTHPFSYTVSFEPGYNLNGVAFTSVDMAGSVLRLADVYSDTVRNKNIYLGVYDNYGTKYDVVFTMKPFHLVIKVKSHDTENIENTGGCYPIGMHEHILGLGENFDAIDNHGKLRRMYLELLTSSESGTNEVHLPIPFLISSKGYGLFINNNHKGFVDVGYNDPGQLCFSFAGYSLELHYFFKQPSASPLTFIGAYTLLTGYPPLPPKWAFGGMFWRDSYSLNTGMDEVLDDARKIRSLHIPISVLWIDAPWETGENTFDYDTSRFTQPAVMISTLRNEGFNVINWATEYINDPVKSNEPATASYFSEGEQKGYFVTTTTGDTLILPWGRGVGALVDFTNPDAFAWYKNLAKKPLLLGGRGFKLDYGEDIVTSLNGSPLDLYRFSNGQTGVYMQAEYKLLYHKDFYQAASEVYTPSTDGANKFFIIARTGTIGSQSYVDAIWPGDLDNDFSSYTIYSDKSAADGTPPGNVGGLKSAILGGINLGIVGFPFYGSDIGGYRHDAPDKEVMARWIEFGAFSPIMQYGGAGDRRPWAAYDKQLLSIYETYAGLYASLFPYIYTYAYLAHTTGVPIMRALFFSYPHDQTVFNYPYEYMFGDALLVAPVTNYAGNVDVYLPKGLWFDFWTGAPVTGPSVLHLSMPLDKIPVFVKAGSIIPFLVKTPDTFVNVDNPSVYTLKDTGGQVNFQIWTGASNSFTMFTGYKVTVNTSQQTTVVQLTNALPASTFVNAIIVHYDGSPVFQNVYFNNTVMRRPDTQCKCPGTYFIDNQNKTIIIYPPSSQGSIKILY